MASDRNSQANRAIRLAWIREKELVEKGQGTRDWTIEQQKDILERGRAYDESGKTFEGHHMKNVKKYPDYQDDPENIQFLTRPEHYNAHNRHWKNNTNGFYDPIKNTTTDFGDSLIKKKEFDLSEPIILMNTTSEDVEKKETEINNSKKQESEIKNNKKQKTEKIVSEKSKRTTKKNKGSHNVVEKKGLKYYFGKAIDFYQNNKETINPIVKTVLREGVEVYLAYKAGKSTNHGDKKSTNKTNKKSLGLDEIVKSSLDVSKRNSPEEHIVPSHRQRYGKDKVWKEKKSYKRGGKKDD